MDEPLSNLDAKLRVSTRALRTLDKKGLLRFLKDEGLTLKDVT